jgi:hypothetical protein
MLKAYTRQVGTNRREARDGIIDLEDAVTVATHWMPIPAAFHFRAENLAGCSGAATAADSVPSESASVNSQLFRKAGGPDIFIYGPARNRPGWTLAAETRSYGIADICRWEFA